MRISEFKTSPVYRDSESSSTARETCLEKLTSQINKQKKERLGLEVTYKVILALCLQTTAREFQKED